MTSDRQSYTQLTHDRYHRRHLFLAIGITHETYTPRIPITHETLIRREIKELKRRDSPADWSSRCPQTGITSETFSLWLMDKLALRRTCRERSAPLDKLTLAHMPNCGARLTTAGRLRPVALRLPCASRRLFKFSRESEGTQMCMYASKHLSPMTPFPRRYSSHRAVFTPNRYHTELY